MVEKNNSLDFDIELGEQKNSHSNLPTSARDLEASSTNVAGEEANHPSFMPKFLRKTANPGFCVLHLSLKVTALVVYLIMTLVTDQKTLNFIIVVILSAFDFWITKNLTGR